MLVTEPFGLQQGGDMGSSIRVLVGKNKLMGKYDDEKYRMWHKTKNTRANSTHVCADDRGVVDFFMSDSVRASSK